MTTSCIDTGVDRAAAPACDRCVADQELIDAIRAGLRAAADPGRAPQMQAYMKSTMPYLGVRLPEVRRIVAAQLRTQPVLSATSAVQTATILWREAVYREERYAAAALIRTRQADPALLPLYQEMIVSGAWWDHVDEAASRIGDLLLAHPQTVRPILLAWSTDPDQWLRRASIICQVGHKARTDPELLRDVITPNTGDRDFFIRKAIGWALRDYGRTEPRWVREFVAERQTLLSPLSVREATKYIM